jgi:hypothetical protein
MQFPRLVNRQHLAVGQEDDLCGVVGDVVGRWEIGPTGNVACEYACTRAICLLMLLID